MNREEVQERLRRKAVIMEIGGFRPPDAPLQSWFGRVDFGAPGENWPMAEGQPMYPLCQLNLSLLPFRPPGLEDISFLSVFIAPDRYPDGDPNGSGWQLRAYSDLEQLVPLEQVACNSPVKSFPMRALDVVDDFPCREDVPMDVSAGMDAETKELFYDLFENHSGFKLGGWPTLIQSEICWAPMNRHPASPEYVFQIDSTEKGNWAWGDGGVGYFGRGAAEGHRDDWCLEWQCY